MALSSTESEYYAAADAVREAARVRALHHDLGYVTGPITVFEDNQSCIRQAANPCDREGQKHIDVRAHYLREQVHQSNVTMEYVSTEKQIADALSKNLPKPAFERQSSHTDGTGTESSHTTCFDQACELEHTALDHALTSVARQSPLCRFSSWVCVCWLIQGLSVNGTAQTATSGSRRIGTRVAGALDA
jgi:hypothetical protein